MAKADGIITLMTKVDTSGITKSTTEIKNAANSMSKAFGKIGSALGITFGVAALVKFGKQAINVASDLQEVQNVVDVAFGNMAYKMEEFSQSAIKMYGISRLTAKKTGSTYMAMAKGMGIADEAASNMALQLTALSADMASFYNVSQEMADIALKSVFTGETETLKQYGIVMTQVNLQEFARQQGITKNIQKMTQQEQVMLRYNYIMQQTALAQGDFARTSDSWANQTRILAQEWQEFQAVIGETLVILLTDLLPVLETAVKWLTTLALYISAFIKGLKGEQKTVSQSIKTTNKSTKSTIGASKATKDLGTSTGKTNKKLKDTAKTLKETNKQLTAFDTLMTLATETTSELPDASDTGLDQIGGGIGNLGDIGAIGGGMGDLSGISGLIDPETMKKIDDFQKWVTEHKDGIKTAFEVAGILALIGAFSSLIGKIGSLLGWFGKKDKALDTQTQKTNTETSAVGDLAGAFAGATVPAYGFATGLNGVTNKGTDLVPQLGLVFDGLGKTIAQFGLAGIILNAFNPVQATTNGLVTEAAQNVANLQAQTETSMPVISSQTQGAFDTSTLAVNNFVATKQPVADWNTSVSNNVQIASDNAKIATSDGFGEAETNITDFSTNTKQAIYDWADNLRENFKITRDNVSNAVYDGFQSAATNISTFVSQTSTGIADWATNVANNAATAARRFATNWGSAIASAWGNFKDFAAATGESMAGFWKENKATIITVGALAGLAAIGIALAPVTGGASLALPALAQGAVLPPNKPFMAMVGDQKNGTNIETPLATMVDAFKIAMQETGGQNINITFDGSMAQFVKMLQPKIAKESQRRGNNLISGVSY